MNSKSIIVKYVLSGLILGFVFPILGILICIFLLVPENYNITFYGLHKDFPLLLIIDLAPIVLALVSYIVGSKVNESNIQFLKKINDINEKLIVQNNEKGVLLKEIHHRVKNNLQVITSLLSLQSSFIEDEKMKGLFRYSQYRINSMAVIHEMLYQSKDISKINYKDYLNTLVNGLINSMKGADNKVKLTIDVPEIYLNIDTAIPLGLMINEIITNSLKYGIKNDQSGEILIRMKKIKDPNYILYIEDNGEGFSKEINFRTSNSLGLMLIHRLTLQLKGNIEMDNSKKGTNYIIHFQQIEQTS